MFLSNVFNLGSIVIGLISWTIPLVFISRSKKYNKSFTPYAIASFSACAIAILLQILEIRNRVGLGDFSAIMDTIGAITLAAVTLTVSTIFLNIQGYKKEKESRI